jgi:succinoglycan biosynthesis transport protein ExoP
MAKPGEVIQKSRELAEKPIDAGVVRIVRGGAARERPQEFDVKKYLRLMYKKRYTFVAVMILVTGIIVAVSFLLPNKYEASSIVLVSGSYTNDVMKGIAAPVSIDDRAKAVEIVMQSRPQVLKVLKQIGYDLSQDTEEDINGLVRSFQKATTIALNVNMSRRNVDMFTVSMKHKNPFIARDYVNTLVRLYIDESQSSKRVEATGANKFLMDQVAVLKQKISAIDSEIAGIQHRNASSRRVITNVARTRLVELRKQLHSLLLRYTPNHPEVEKIQDEISYLEGQVDGKGHDTADDSARESGRAGGPGSLDFVRGEQRLKELERDRESYQKMYGEMLATLGKSEVSSSLEVEDKGLTFNVIEPAVLPLRPVSPNRLLLIILGFFAGIGAAIGSVILMDSMDRSVKSIDMAKKFGHPVLAMFPYVQLPREKDRVQVLNVLLFTVTLLYVAGMVVLAVVISMG